MTKAPDTRMVLSRIAKERERQDKMWGTQRRYPFGFGLPGSERLLDEARENYESAAGMENLCWSHVLTEEVAELFAAKSLEEIELEAIQVAAVACLIAERAAAERAPIKGVA